MCAWMFISCVTCLSAVYWDYILLTVCERRDTGTAQLLPAQRDAFGTVLLCNDGDINTACLSSGTVGEADVLCWFRPIFVEMIIFSPCSRGAPNLSRTFPCDMSCRIGHWKAYCLFWTLVHTHVVGRLSEWLTNPYGGLRTMIHTIILLALCMLLL